MAQYSHNASQIYHEVTGDGEPVLVLPGFSQRTTDYSALISALERIAFDQVHLLKGDTKHNQRLACLGSPSI